MKPKNKVQENEIEKYNSSYISDELKNSESDVVYKMKNEDVFFLIEHQTKIDYSMAYRILKYELSIIDSCLSEPKVRYKNKGYIYPLIIPIVLYTGTKKWDAKLNLKEVQLQWREYAGLELSRYNVLDINDLDNKKLLQEENTISKLLVIEKSNNQNEFIENLKEIDAEQILKNLKFERGDNMFRVEEMFKREERRFRAEGKREGKREGKIEIIKNMLREKEAINKIALFSGMNEKEIEKIAKEMN